MPTDKITVVIPNYNGRDALRRAMDSVLAQVPASCLIVVDDGSADDSVRMVRTDYPEVRLLCHKENRGFAAAANTGIREARAPYVFLLNNDAVLLPGALAALLRTMEQAGDSTFSVGAKMLTMKKPRQIDNCGDLYAICGWAFTPGLGADPGWYNKRCAVTTACAGAALYRRELLLSLGLFDEAHFCYLEDVDLGIRARLRGYRNLYEPAALVLHEGSASSGGKRHSPFKVRLTAGNNLYLLYKNFPAPFLALHAGWIAAGILVKGVYFARQGMGAAYLEGLREGLKKISEYREKNDAPVVRLWPLLGLTGEMFVNLVRRFSG